MSTTYLHNFLPHLQTWYLDWSSPDMNVVLNYAPNEFPSYRSLRYHIYKVPNVKAKHQDPHKLLFLWNLWLKSKRKCFIKIDTDTIVFLPKLTSFLQTQNMSSTLDSI